MCLNKKIFYMSLVLNMAKFLIWHSSEYGRILNIQALHSVVNIPEYQNMLDSFLKYLGSKYARNLNISGF